MRPPGHTLPAPWRLPTAHCVRTMLQGGVTVTGDVFGICPLLSVVRLKTSALRAVDKAACDRPPTARSQHDRCRCRCRLGEQRLDQEGL